MRNSIKLAAEAVKRYMPSEQFTVLMQGVRNPDGSGEERAMWRETLRKLHKQISGAPVTYEQDGKGDDAVVHLHYFAAGCDWWITERDKDGGIHQMFGLVQLNGGEPELGYIHLPEVLALKDRAGIPLTNLDFHWEPKTVAQVKAGMV